VESRTQLIQLLPLSRIHYWNNY